MPTNTETTSLNRTYVLIHGAWFGGWVWQEVASLLRDAGHTVYTPSLTGLGERRHLRGPGVTLRTHADDILNLLFMEDLHDVVLVGWSYGGMVVNEVIALAPERLRSVVYLDAMMPEPGRCHASYTTAHPVDAMIDLAATGQDIPPLSAQSIGIAEDSLARYVDARLAPHPVLTFLTPSRSPTELPDLSYTYVLAGAFLDTSKTFEYFYDVFRERSLGHAYVIDTGHTMMLTMPQETAQFLLDAL